MKRNHWHLKMFKKNIYNAVQKFNCYAAKTVLFNLRFGLRFIRNIIKPLYTTFAAAMVTDFLMSTTISFLVVLPFTTPYSAYT
jgi:hypothetical protein